MELTLIDEVAHLGPWWATLGLAYSPPPTLWATSDRAEDMGGPWPVVFVINYPASLVYPRSIHTSPASLLPREEGAGGWSLKQGQHTPLLQLKKLLPSQGRLGCLPTSETIEQEGVLNTPRCVTPFNAGLAPIDQGSYRESLNSLRPPLPKKITTLGDISPSSPPLPGVHPIYGGMAPVRKAFPLSVAGFTFSLRS
ncbi:hypothetical protein [Lewinella sp. LCG006]|uniref:hypothetical protein n=1 Tax=Lewinella sp. LCG006 TaxID=3231911 RepID=UPI00345F9D9E